MSRRTAKKKGLNGHRRILLERGHPLEPDGRELLGLMAPPGSSASGLWKVEKTRGLLLDLNDAASHADRTFSLSTLTGFPTALGHTPLPTADPRHNYQTHNPFVRYPMLERPRFCQQRLPSRMRRRMRIVLELAASVGWSNLTYELRPLLLSLLLGRGSSVALVSRSDHPKLGNISRLRINSINSWKGRCYIQCSTLREIATLSRQGRETRHGSAAVLFSEYEERSTKATPISIGYHIWGRSASAAARMAGPICTRASDKGCTSLK
ncbi:hypothetical protein SODALDRAFT_379444 [Sodiomyces alkalinus F11]|uniref:Uncharacterized protein n=1 Tax=Sodiomyces alkalinus (strain CBS 110278 / VKM F-3762 / F11) TaxID=1314773 RepID=A0A3N2PUU2_SODAK|nr:hypothetical protein SODALDRAFT_379444 [Sodiomyces alkalinus F11]ROT38250.1 hypothetical protein SODALDRAFT_379444 [Sodiomyces alkalinus F11]